MWAGRFRFVIFVCVALMTTGCSRAPLNPPRLVMSSDTDMTVQLFMQSTILLANYYGYTGVTYGEIRERARRSNVNMIDFVMPEAIRATPALRNFANRYEDDPAALTEALQRIGGYKNLVKYYIRTGLRASQSLCRTYMLEIEEKNDFLEFVQKEIGVAYALSTAVLALASANSTLMSSFMIARTGVDGGIDAFQEYRYLKIDRDAARAVVEAAQNQLAQYFMEQVDKSAANQNLVTGGYTFSDALHAVSTIEYQCTRSGIRNLLSRSINNSPANLTIDQDTGNITFRTAKDAQVKDDPLLGGRGGTVGGPGPGDQPPIVNPPKGGGVEPKPKPKPDEPKPGPKPDPVASCTNVPTLQAAKGVITNRNVILAQNASRVAAPSPTFGVNTAKDAATAVAGALGCISTVLGPAIDLSAQSKDDLKKLQTTIGLRADAATKIVGDLNKAITNKTADKKTADRAAASLNQLLNGATGLRGAIPLVGDALGLIGG
jgi:hypothetical protein